MEGLEQRLARLESRLERLERQLGLTSPPSATGKASFTFQAPPAEPSPDYPRPPRPASAAAARQAHRETPTPSSGGAVTRLLGWSGSLALVLAAAYLIKLAYDSGWLSLSPQARVGIALLSSTALIGTGLYLRQKDRHYASLLPATGIVILFLAIYGAHLYYHFIGSGTAGLGVVLACCISLWLCRQFDSDLYALFAIAGSYSAPFLIHGATPGIWSLMLYFSAWDIGFCLFSLFTGRRRHYLLALYLALVGFDLLWRETVPFQWQAALGYQTLQLLIFAASATFFSLRHKRPLDMRGAALHLPALLIFYILQYSLLHRHLPVLAPWLAIISVFALGLFYLAARLLSGRNLQGGRLILICYGTLALLHAGYLELVPATWRPWLALLTLPALAAWLAANRAHIASDWPLLAALGLLWLVGFGQAVSGESPVQTAGSHLLPLFHALELYGGYALLRQATGRLRLLPGALIYLGHLAAMAAAWHILTNSLSVSLAWGLLSLVCLGLALKLGDRMLGQSSLLLFAFSALKVLLFDLAEASPPVRIGCLLVVGVTFYVGGWLYRRIEDMTPPART